jgi:HAD superfamily hydrolase (TIGR01662 family)
MQAVEGLPCPVWQGCQGIFALKEMEFLLLDSIKSLRSMQSVILFDLDGTLCLRHPPYNQVFYDHAVGLGLEDGPEKRRRAARWVHYYWAQSDELLADRQNLWDEQEQRFWTNYAVRSLLAFECTEECARELAPELSRYMREEHHAEDYVPEDVPQTLQALKNAGYRLGMFSNRIQPYHDLLQQLELAEYFELVLAAGEISCWKPEPGSFQQVVQRMAAEPAETLYVGDNYYADILGAQRAGLQAVLLDPEEFFPEADCPVIQQISDLEQLIR